MKKTVLVRRTCVMKRVLLICDWCGRTICDETEQTTKPSLVIVKYHFISSNFLGGYDKRHYCSSECFKSAHDNLLSKNPGTTIQWIMPKSAMP